MCSYCLLLNERIAERRKSLVSDKHSKTGIFLHMPTVHPVLLQTARTVLLDALDTSIMNPFTYLSVYYTNHCRPILINEGWNASHLISSSEPHAAHFLVRATSKCSSVIFPFLNVPFVVVLKLCPF